LVERTGQPLDGQPGQLRRHGRGFLRQPAPHHPRGGVMKRAWIAAAAAAALLAFPLTAQASTAAGPGPVVPTDRGPVQGKVAEGIDQFLGIPYAAPPAGALRWAAPRPAPRWHGVRQATSYGARCAQLASGNGPRSDSED